MSLSTLPLAGITGFAVTVPCSTGVSDTVYLSGLDAVPPASVIFAIISSASASVMFSLSTFGTPSTSVFASSRVLPVISLTAFITASFFAGSTLSNVTVYKSFVKLTFTFVFAVILTFARVLPPLPSAISADSGVTVHFSTL